MSSIAGRALLALLLDVLGVVLDVAAIEHRVLGCGDVDERRLHAGQHVLHTTDVDVAVDLADVVGGSRDVVLDQVAALEHGHLRHVVAHLHAHQVATGRAAVALATATLLDEVIGHDARGVTGTAAAPAAGPLALAASPVGSVARAGAGAASVPAACRCSCRHPCPTWRRDGSGSDRHRWRRRSVATSAAGSGTDGRRAPVVPAGAGRVSPIWGLRTSARSAASGEARPSRNGSGRSG